MILIISLSLSIPGYFFISCYRLHGNSVDVNTKVFRTRRVSKLKNASCKIRFAEFNNPKGNRFEERNEVAFFATGYLIFWVLSEF